MTYERQNMLNEQYFNEAARQLERRRSENQAEADRRRREVYRKIPEYRVLEQQLADTSSRLIALILQHTDNIKDKVEELSKENLDIQKSMEQLLQTAGFSGDYLEPVYTCPKCHDTGSADGRRCDCFERLMLSAAAEQMNAVSPLTLSSFDSFNTALYPDVTEPAMNATQREVMESNLSFCRKYAENFTLESGGILMTGATGLGKTHLSLAIADTVIKKGYEVIYGSVPELLRTIEKEHFGRASGDTTEVLTGCDLLILDDLGAEMDKPLYTSVLYELINARVSRRLPLIVSTNLTGGGLRERYQDRISSRLFSFELLMFCGRDIRTQISGR